MTKKAKLEQFDALKADRDTMHLVLFDVVNNRFGTPYVINCQDYDKSCGKGTRLEMSASWRAMPLFLIYWHNPGQKHKTPYYMTECDLEDLSRRADTPHQRMLRDAFQALCRDHFKERTAQTA